MLLERWISEQLLEISNAPLTFWNLPTHASRHKLVLATLYQRAARSLFWKHVDQSTQARAVIGLPVSLQQLDRPQDAQKCSARGHSNSAVPVATPPWFLVEPCASIHRPARLKFRTHWVARLNCRAQRNGLNSRQCVPRYVENPLGQCQTSGCQERLPWACWDRPIASDVLTLVTCAQAWACIAAEWAGLLLAGLTP